MTLPDWVAVGSLFLSIVVLSATIGVHITNRLVRIETILTGIDGSNGMYSDIRDIRKAIPSIEIRIQILEERLGAHLTKVNDVNAT
jgi:hypothetical protein